MSHANAVKILRLHFGEGDRFDGRPLQEAILAKCREFGIAGATVFRGVQGFGETAEIHKSHVVSHDQPIVVVIVDSAENVFQLKSAVADMMQTGLIAVSDAQAIRVAKSPDANPTR